MKAPRPHETKVTLGSIQFLKTGAGGFSFADPYSFAVSLSWAGFALLFVVLEIGINAVFGLLYFIVPGSVANLPAGSYLNAFFFSVETLATVGYGVMAPVTPYGHVVSGVEIISGTAFTAIMTGLTFVRFSRPRANILYADTVVIGRHNGQRTLMLRIASGRSSLMTDASARLSVLLLEHTQEGQFLRRPYDLTLLRDRWPLFAITLTLMHTITPDSPLYGLDAEAMREGRLRLFLTIEARDVKLDAVVHDLHDWGPDQIAFDMHYADAVHVNDDGVAVADLTRISLIEPDATRPEQPD